MENTIKGLLRKRVWKGEEVGQALLASLVYEAKMRDLPHTPLFSVNDLERMIRGIIDANGHIAFSTYQALYDSITYEHNKAQAKIQQFYSGFFQYLYSLQEIMTAERGAAVIDEYPFLMTETQYKRLTEAVEQKNRDKPAELREVVFKTLEHYLTAEGWEEAPEQIKAAMIATGKEKADNPRVLTLFCKDKDIGFYMLKDGRKSDLMGVKRWNSVLEKHKKEHELDDDRIEEKTLKGFKLLLKGVDAIKAACVKRDIALPEDMGEQEIMEAMDTVLEAKQPGGRTDAIYRLVFGGPAVFHHYDVPTKALTKLDVLTIMLGRYKGAHPGDISTDEQYKEFKQDYKDLHKVIIEYIEGYTKEPMGKHWKSTVAELEKLGLPAYKDATIAEESDILETYQKERKIRTRKSRSIAILQNPMPDQVDAQGDYLESKSALEAEEGLLKLRESDIGEVTRKLSAGPIQDAMSHIYAYNALIDIIGEAYNIDGAEVFKLDINEIEDRIRVFNDSLYKAYMEVAGTKAAKRQKRALLNELIQPLETKPAKPSDELIAKVEKKIKALGLTRMAEQELKDLDGFRIQLTAKGVG